MMVNNGQSLNVNNSWPSHIWDLKIVPNESKDSPDSLDIPIISHPKRVGVQNFDFGEGTKVFMYYHKPRIGSD